MLTCRAGMLFAASTVSSSMLSACTSDNTCGTPGFDVSAPGEQIVDVLVSDPACQDVTASCVATDSTGACTKYYVVPIATGNCHVDVDLGKGTRFSDDVKIIRGPSGCDGFYPEVPADTFIEAP